MGIVLPASSSILLPVFSCNTFPAPAPITAPIAVAASSGGANNPTASPTAPRPSAPSLTMWSVCSTDRLPSRSLLTTTAPMISAPQFRTAS